MLRNLGVAPNRSLPIVKGFQITPTWRIIPLSKWLITMLCFRPLNRVGPLPNGRTPWLINGGDPNYVSVRPGSPSSKQLPISLPNQVEWTEHDNIFSGEVTTSQGQSKTQKTSNHKCLEKKSTDFINPIHYSNHLWRLKKPTLSGYIMTI